MQNAITNLKFLKFMILAKNAGSPFKEIITGQEMKIKKLRLLAKTESKIYNLKSQKYVLNLRMQFQ